MTESPPQEPSSKSVSTIKLVGTDIDGVWTDATMYYTADGDFMKAFSAYDGAGVQLLRDNGIEVVILTGENSPIVSRRAEKLGITRVWLGEKHKLKRMRYICQQLNIRMDEVAYIGDDINDLALLKEVGFSALPPNSPIQHRFTPDYVTLRRGGEGAFRDFVEEILSSTFKS